MKTILEQYFIEFGQIDLLSFGSLKWQKKEASFSDNGIDAPKESIQFEPISSSPSKHFYIYLADALSISSDQAAIQYEQFIQDLFDGHQEEITLESLGSFHFVNGILQWNSHFISNAYYTEVYFNKVSNEPIHEVNSEDSKDNWGLYASIIAILSLLAVLYKFYH